MATKPNKRGRDRESTWERIPNNGSENDPKSWNQNGITDKYHGDKDWDARKVEQGLRRNKKKSQYIMNNAINEIKSILEGTNSRITEAEDRISEVEDRIEETN